MTILDTSSVDTTLKLDLLTVLPVSYISGTTKDENGDPIQRVVILMNDSGIQKLQTKVSNQDGTYSFAINAGPSEKFTVMYGTITLNNHQIYGKIEPYEI